MINKLIELCQQLVAIFVSFKSIPTSPSSVKQLNGNKNPIEIPSYTNDKQQKNCLKLSLTFILMYQDHNMAVKFSLTLCISLFILQVEQLLQNCNCILLKTFLFLSPKYNSVLRKHFKDWGGGEGLKSTLNQSEKQWNPLWWFLVSTPLNVCSGWFT